ncbi:MAG: hypothetical protein ACI9WS_000719 [Paraglaciecola psychrophila]|jgi:hypothetical protein
MFVSPTTLNHSEESTADILDRAEHQRISLDELDFLLLSLYRLSAKRLVELQRVQALLLDLESRREQPL